MNHSVLMSCIFYACRNPMQNPYELNEIFQKGISITIMVTQNHSGPKNQCKGCFGSQDFCVLTKSGMKHVGMNPHSKYQGNEIKSNRGLCYVNKGSYHWVYKKKFDDQVQRKFQQDRKNKQRKVHSVKKKNEHNLKHGKTQNEKRSSGFNIKKSKCCSKSKIYSNKCNNRPNLP
jgi:hypothetical protein